MDLTRSGHELDVDADWVRTGTGYGRGLTTVLVGSRTGHGHGPVTDPDNLWIRTGCELGLDTVTATVVVTDWTRID
jgi:hypothetical protein